MCPAAPVIIVEGVSASRRELADLRGRRASGWTATPPSRSDGASRATAGTMHARRFWDEWQAEERPLLDADRPWERADLLVLGTPTAPAPAGTWWARWGPGGRLRV